MFKGEVMYDREPSTAQTFLKVSKGMCARPWFIALNFYSEKELWSYLQKMCC